MVVEELSTSEKKQVIKYFLHPKDLETRHATFHMHHQNNLEIPSYNFVIYMDKKLQLHISQVL